MTTFVSIHHVASLKATAGTTSGAPLIIDIVDDKGHRAGDVTLFLGNHVFAQRLADAINAACAPVKIEEAGDLTPLNFVLEDA